MFRFCAVLSCGVIAACVTAPPPAAKVAPAREDTQSSVQRWQPGPGAAAALEALWKAEPFALPAARLALASGGVVPRMHQTEMLLFEEEVRVGTAARSSSVSRTVYRLLGDSPANTLTFSWTPWRQERPKVRARVIGPDGSESWIDEASIVEGSADGHGIELTDVRVLQVPLPNARRGSVVELQVTRKDLRALVEGAGKMASYDLWSFSPVRRMRVVVEAPEGTPLQLDSVGIAEPRPVVRGGVQRVAVEVGELEFKPLQLTLSQIRQRKPRFSWSTGPAWSEVARRYRALLDEALADRVELSSLKSLTAPAKSVRDKVQVVSRWLGEHVRYTALQLGEGAIVPTRPSQVLARGFGDCKDLAVLMVVALRSLGIEAEPAAVMADGQVPSDRIPGLAAFNHMIVAVADGNETLWVDATAPKYPVGVVPLEVRDQRALIVSAKTTGLTPTPTRAQTPFFIRETFEYELASFGTGRARVAVESTGAAEGMRRSALPTCDEASGHKLAETSMASVFGQIPFTATMKNCHVGDGPVTAAVDIAEAEGLDTGDRAATVSMPSRVLDLVIEDQLRGEPPGSDTRTSEQKADQARRLHDETGLTEAEVTERGYSFDYHPMVERVYRIKLPPRFTAGTLPADRTLNLGPALWTESYRQVDPRTVEVRFQFNSAQVEYTAADVRHFREACWKRWDEPIPSLSVSFEPIKLLEEKKPGEGVALMRRWLTETPGDGATRARYARTLLLMGLGELARAEAERAVRDAPEDALALMVRADVARHDRFGLRYEAPFERVVAITYFRKALSKLPNHTWVAQALAETLRRNDAGEAESRWTPEVAEAARVLQERVDDNRASDGIVDSLLDLYLRTRHYDEIKRLIDKRPQLRERDERLSLVNEALTSGVDGMLRRLEQIDGAKERLTALLRAYFMLAQMHRFGDATALLTRFRTTPAIELEVARVRTLNQGLKEAPDTINVSNPEAAARSVFAVVANGSTRTDMSRRLASLASATAKSELDGTARFFDFVRMPSPDASYAYESLYHRGACVTAGRNGTFRVRCEVPEDHSVAVTSYWVTERGGLKLESLGKLGHLAERAWFYASAKKLDAAAQWIDWFIEDQQGRNAYAQLQFLTDFWGECSHTDESAVRFAAALTLVVFSDVAREAPAAVLAELVRGRAALTGSLRRRSDEVVARAYVWRDQRPEAIQILEPLAKSENEPRLWRWLAELLSQKGDTAAALQRVQRALDKDPGNFDWRALLATVQLKAGRYDDALATLTKLAAERGKQDSLRNNLIWAHLMARKLDDTVERDAVELGEAKDAPKERLHTAAMVLLERGRVEDAVAYMMRRQAKDSGSSELDDSIWLWRARLLQTLGFQEESRAAYEKVGKSDPELFELRRRWTTPLPK